MSLDLDVFRIQWSDYWPSILAGLVKTIEYAFAGFAGAIILGLALALLRVSRSRLFRSSAAIYTEAFKNIPLLALIFIVYFGLASIDVVLTSFQAGCISLILFYAAYLSEIFRSALTAVHHGQREASQALGMSPLTTFLAVIYPQALRMALPGTATMFGDLLKSTSLLVVISASELMTEAQLIASETFRALEVYIVIGVLYFALCYPISQLMLFIERRVRAGAPLSISRYKRLRSARTALARSTSQ